MKSVAIITTITTKFQFVKLQRKHLDITTYALEFVDYVIKVKFAASIHVVEWEFNVSAANLFEIRLSTCDVQIMLSPTHTEECVLDSLLNKKKLVPLHAWSSPEGSRKLRFPDFTTTAQDGGRVVSLTHRPPLPPENAPGTYFC